MFYTLQRKEKLMPKLELTKEEYDFLGDFLDDGLHRELEIGEGQDLETYGDLKARKFLPKIIDKLERKEKKVTYAQITSFTNAFQHTCSDGWITDIVNGKVDIDKLKSFILNYYEEHKDDEGNKVFDEDIEGYFTKDNCSEVFTKTEKGKKKKERQDPIEDEPMCTVCHSSDVYSLSEVDEPYVGHCNECEEDRDLEICELDEKGKIR